VVDGPDAPVGTNPGGAGLSTYGGTPVADRLAPLPQQQAPAAYSGTTAPSERTEASHLVEAGAEVWATDAPMVPVQSIDVPVVEKEDEKRKRDAIVAVPIVPVSRAEPVEEVDVVVPAVPPPAEPGEENVAVRAGEEPEEREELDRPDAAELLEEETERWTPETEAEHPAQDGEHVPLVRPEEKVADADGWDDGADWLHDEKVTDV